ncbi:hypothetical protein VD0004_g6317 [Verticillium dahliae]|nr:hypothetical protein VD0004_g6317 [Verticillium dahliae]
MFFCSNRYLVLSGVFTKPATLVILILHSLGSPEFLLQSTFHFAISRLDNSGT